MPLYRLYLTEGEGKEEDKHKKKITKSLCLATSWGEIWRVFYERRPHGLWKGSNNSWGTSKCPWSILGLKKEPKNTVGVEFFQSKPGVFCGGTQEDYGWIIEVKSIFFFPPDPILPRHTWHTTESLVTMTSNQDKARQERAGYGDMKATYPQKNYCGHWNSWKCCNFWWCLFFYWMSLMMFF